MAGVWVSLGFFPLKLTLVRRGDVLICRCYSFVDKYSLMSNHRPLPKSTFTQFVQTGNSTNTSRAADKLVYIRSKCSSFFRTYLRNERLHATL